MKNKKDFPTYRLYPVFGMLVETQLYTTFEPRHEKTNIFICENKDTDQLRSNNTRKEQNSSTF